MTHRLPRIELLRPELALWGGVLLLLSTVFMSSARFSANLPIVQLPKAGRTTICILKENPHLGLSIDATGRTYLHINDSLMQIRVIMKVAARQGIRITTNQQRRLSTLPYIGLPMRQLIIGTKPTKLVRGRIVQCGIPKNELALYIEEAKNQAIESGRSWPHFTLRLDERLSFSQVNSLYKMLDRHEIHQVGLMVESE
jgi:biopolymer transport protein ExbD